MISPPHRVYEVDRIACKQGSTERVKTDKQCHQGRNNNSIENERNEGRPEIAPPKEQDAPQRISKQDDYHESNRHGQNWRKWPPGKQVAENDETHGVIKSADSEPKREWRRIGRHPKFS